MELIILCIVVVALIAVLGIEVCITSWSIRRAKRYKWQRDEAKRSVESLKEREERTTQRFRDLDRYATDISWLLGFLYNRYGNFADIDKEAEELGGTIKEGDPPNEKYDDLLKAIRLIKITVRACENIKSFMNSIATQLNLITRELNAVSEAEGQGKNQDDNQTDQNNDDDDEDEDSED